ncbi:MAG: branched-chain amino acid transport system II carrier protein [Spirochaetaceae bacterium]|nr:branched-chain amino acid transport system II carrier protein [Spirochaetaceae bacterium]
METNMRKKMMFDSLVLGFALFAIFFGAGNMIFPAMVGLNAGTEWPVALVAAFLAIVVLPLLAVVAVAFGGEHLRDVCKPVGNWFFTFISFLVFTFSSATVSTPRTAATTHEISIQPLFPNVPIWATVIVYFAVVLFLAIDKSKLLDRVGKFLTPALLIFLVIIIVKGAITPPGTPAPTGKPDIFGYTFREFYFTGDLLSGIFFATMFIQSVIAKGWGEESKRKRMMLNTAIVAGILFTFVYCGLLILGAYVNALPGFNAEMGRTALLSGIVDMLLGKFGTVCLAIPVLLACLTTGVGLVSLVSDFYANLTKNKVPYKVWVIGICIICSLLGIFGVEKIIWFGTPSFYTIYPPLIVLTFVVLFKKFVPNDGAYKYSVLFALACGFIDALDWMNTSLGWNVLGFASSIRAFLPLGSLGFSWIAPAIAGFIIGGLKYRFVKPKTAPAN